MTPAAPEKSWWSQFFKRGGSTHQAAEGQAKPRKVRQRSQPNYCLFLSSILYIFTLRCQSKSNPKSTLLTSERSYLGCICRSLWPRYRLLSLRKWHGYITPQHSQHLNRFYLFAHYSFAEANEWSQVYGMLLLPVAIAFTAYALWMYTKRAAMIRRKDPGPCKLIRFNSPCISLNETDILYLSFLPVHLQMRTKLVRLYWPCSSVAPFS